MEALYHEDKLEKSVEELTSEFYTVIPHRIGRSKAEIRSAIISTPEAFEQKRGFIFIYYLNF